MGTQIVKLKISCRIEEVPALGGFLLASLNTDLPAFTNFSPDFNAAYVTSGLAQLTSMTNLIFPFAKTAELKQITLGIYTWVANLEQPIDFLEGYVNRSTGLTVSAADFRINKIKQARNNGDVEKLTQALNYTLQLCNDATNAPILLAKGFTAAQKTFLTDAKDELLALNVAQNQKVIERNDLMAANYVVINKFWVLLMDIADAGKRIYKKTNKKDDYTMAVLKRRIRQEMLKNKMAGTITFAGAGLPGAKVAMVPVGGGRRRSTKSKAGGPYELKSVAAIDWIVTVSAPGKQSIVEAVTIVTGQTLTKDYVMVAQ